MNLYEMKNIVVFMFKRNICRIWNR